MKKKTLHDCLLQKLYENPDLILEDRLILENGCNVLLKKKNGNDLTDIDYYEIGNNVVRFFELKTTLCARTLVKAIEQLDKIDNYFCLLEKKEFYILSSYNNGFFCEKVK